MIYELLEKLADQYFELFPTPGAKGTLQGILYEAYQIGIEDEQKLWILNSARFERNLGREENA